MLNEEFQERVKIEAERRPLSRQKMIPGFSVITFVGLATIAAFFFLVTQVTPRWVNNISAAVSSGSATSTPLVALEVPTEAPTLPPAPTDTPPPALPATPTVAVEYAQVANTDGLGVRLRAKPQQAAARVTSLPERTIVQIIGPDQKNTEGTWRNVRTTDGSNDEGWINSRYLEVTVTP